MSCHHSSQWDADFSGLSTEFHISVPFYQFNMRIFGDCLEETNDDEDFNQKPELNSLDIVILDFGSVFSIKDLQLLLSSPRKPSSRGKTAEN